MKRAQGLACQPSEIRLVFDFKLRGQSPSKAVAVEGTEMPRQLGTLRELNCHLGHGCLLSRPSTAQAMFFALHNDLLRFAARRWCTRLWPQCGRCRVDAYQPCRCHKPRSP